jgi:hypothetical protein
MKLLSVVRFRLPRFTPSSFCAAFSMFVLAIQIAGVPSSAQVTADSGSKLHKFHPKVAPQMAAKFASAQDLRPSENGMSAFAARQISALNKEKESRTPAQKKIDSNVLYTARMLGGQPAAPSVNSLNTGIDLDEHNNIVVDMVADVTPVLLRKLSSAGAQVLSSNASMRSIRAIIAPDKIEAIAALSDVIFISPMQQWSTSGHSMTPAGSGVSGLHLAPGFGERAAKVRQQIAKSMSKNTDPPCTGQGSVETEGDAAHQACNVRNTYGLTGAGLKIGVLSDGVTHSSTSQGTGDLPPTCGNSVPSPCLTVLSGQAGDGDEGTAMLEIIHDMAPGADLYFATADNGLASFAANIAALRAAGCNIIVDDAFYFEETPFQDGQAASVTSTSNGGLITQAVNQVVADGAFYFTSAGNGGNLDDGTSGTYEGDFVPIASASPLSPGNVHNFGSGQGYDIITNPGFQAAYLWWADPLGGSSNDYDLYVLSSDGSQVLSASTNVQDGTQDPLEQINDGNVDVGNRLVVSQFFGANRFFHLVVYRGGLAVSTDGETHGHSAASGAYSVAATPAAATWGPPTPDGPYPGPFVSTDQVEQFSSDGPRRIFFNADSSPITPGDFSSTGGSVLDKPEITAADGVSVTGVGGFDNPFYGTSAAAPAAASVAALVLLADPNITAAQMKNVLTHNAIDIMDSGPDRDSGAGIVMALASVTSVAVPSSIDPNTSSLNQMTQTGTAFANPLVATVKNSLNHPVSGASVTFTAPSTGASGTFSNGISSITVKTDSSGVVSEPLTANNIVGPFEVTATINNLSTFFTLANTPSQVAVPNVVGDTQTAASTAITGASLVVGSITQASSNTVPVGSVISESPSSGILVKLGSAINLVVSYGPAQVVITWPTPAPITYGTALSAIQLDATANVAGTITYSSNVGAVLNAGTQTLTATFTPSDSVHYSVTTAIVSLMVNKTTPVLHWTPAVLPIGSKLTAAQLDGTANVSGKFVYTPALGTTISTSIENLKVVFTPTSTTNYNSVTDTVQLPVNAVRLTPLSIDFGTVYLGTITKKNITVTNLGNSAVTISAPLISIVKNGDSREFLAANLCPKSLAAHASCTFQISFIAGPYYHQQSATLKVTDSSPGSPQPVSLTALTIDPQAQLSTTSLSFGSQTLNTASAAKTIKLTNTGATELAIDKVAVSSGDLVDFDLTNECGSSLSPGSSCSIDMTFKPKAKGVRSAKLVITDNAKVSTQTVTMSGTGD